MGTTISTASHAAPPAELTPPIIGVFDSGVGGLSVLRALHQRLPEADYLYVADSGHAPYGERSDAFITERTERVAQHLVDHGAGLLVLACNTATAVAASHLRSRWPALPLVAVEPGLKPAAALSRSGRIGVMATPATLRSEKFKLLMQAHGQGLEVHLQPCPGLAGLIEQVDADDPALAALVDTFCQPLRANGVDTVVLGCTHYPFIAPQIQAALSDGIRLLDTSEAVARQAARLWSESVAIDKASGMRSTVRLQSTGDLQRLRLLATRWLPFAFTIDHAPSGL